MPAAQEPNVEGERRGAPAKRLKPAGQDKQDAYPRQSEFMPPDLVTEGDENRPPSVKISGSNGVCTIQNPGPEPIE
jgi:hypothetical protein